MYARLYTRVSTDEQAETGFSLAAQRDRLEAFCFSQGWDIAGFYVDEGASAKDLNRPELQRLFDEAQRGDVILVYKLDRLTRSVRDLDDLLRQWDREGLLFRSSTENFDTTNATGRLFIRLVAEIAQWERETIAERSSLGKRQKANAGEWGGGPVPIGYMAVPSERVKAGRTLLKLVPDPQTQHVIPMIFEQYLSGQGIRGVSVWLNDELGARTPQGNRFHRLTISRILSNPIYCGDIMQGRRKKGPTTRVPGSHEPLIPREVFDKVQELHGIRALYAPRHATGMYPLSGVAKCGVCGGRIDGQKRGDKAQNRIYRCHNYMIGSGCGRGDQRGLASVSAKFVEGNLVQEIEYLHQDPANLNRLIADFAAKAADRTGLTQAEVKRLEADLGHAEVAVNQWKRLYEQRKISPDEYLEEVRPHKDRIAAIKERLAEYARQVVDLPNREALGQFAINFRESWDGLVPAEQKALLQQFVQAFGLEIVIFPDRRVGLQPNL